MRKSQSSDALGFFLSQTKRQIEFFNVITEGRFGIIQFIGNMLFEEFQGSLHQILSLFCQELHTFCTQFHGGSVSFRCDSRTDHTAYSCRNRWNL